MIAIYLLGRPALSGWWLVVFAALLYAPGVWAAGECERVYKKTDPGCVVIDEVVGQALTLSVIPTALSGSEGFFGGWKLWLTGFILFRGFDIVKPFPIRRLEKLPGGFGIMTDDVLAGIYGAIVLAIIVHFGWL